MKSEFEKYFKENHADSFYSVDAALEMRGDDYIDFHAADLWALWQHQQSKVDELTKQLIEQGQRLNAQNQQIATLKWQLKRLGYTDNGGELMKPPIGDAPKFDLLDELQKHKSLQELEINQISHANQQWQLKCSELQKRVDELENTQSRFELKAEEAECVSMCLDDHGVAKCDQDGKSYSLWGRVCQFKKTGNFTEDDLERIYGEFDSERAKQGEERLRFKEALRGLLEQALKGENK